jgi:hypothetical protein
MSALCGASVTASVGRQVDGHQPRDDVEAHDPPEMDKTHDPGRPSAGRTRCDPRVKRSVAVILFVVAACGGTTTPSAGAVGSQAPTANEASPALQASGVGAEASPTLDPEAVRRFRAALARFFESQSQMLAESAGLDADADWPSAQAVFTKQADAYGALYRDLRGISWPNPGEDSGGLGTDSTALMAWAQELESVVRKSVASTSWKEAQESVVEFEGATYPFLRFLQEATGEFYAALDQTARDLGIELPKSTAAPTSVP